MKNRFTGSQGPDRKRDRPSRFPTLFASLAAIAALATLLLPAVVSAEATLFTGMCDASAAAAIDPERFVVADDEDNILRIYSRRGGAALSEYDMSGFLGVQGKKKSKETDLEAATQVGRRTFWITSHGRNSSGKDQPERQRLFVTETRASRGNVQIVPIGKPYDALLDALIADERLARFNLEGASKLAPKAPGGLNIEGLAGTPDGHLLIGFRSPVRGGRSLVVPLLNPSEVVSGGSAKLGVAMELDLQGLGIRSMERVGGRYVIIAGSSGEGGKPSRLFEWDGQGTPKAVPGVKLGGLNAEGVAFHGEDGAGEFFVLSDDGTREIAGQDCKDLKDPSLKRFRGRLLRW